MTRPPIDLSQHPEVWPSITEDDNGRLTLHWPEGRRSVEVTREVLQVLVDRINGGDTDEG